MCGRRATLKEHVPPKCLFPEQKDLGSSADLRKNLITVPACNRHNLEKSQDDQFICTIMATYIWNNPTASAHFSSKVMRSLRRRPSMLSFFQERVPVRTPVGWTVGFVPDLPRYERVMEQIARGIYYHHFRTRHTGPVDTISHTLLAIHEKHADEINTQLQVWGKASASFFTGMPPYGDNPEVFYYQVVESEEGMKLSVAIRQVFYEGFTVDAAFYPSE
jgi:hypothetical protein